MAVKVKHRGIMRQEQERLLEISFGWQSGPTLPSQRYLQERLLWLLFQQYPAMLFYRLPAWAGVGRACQHRQSGNLSSSSIGGWKQQRRERLKWDGGWEMRQSSKGLLSFCGVTWCSPPNKTLSSSHPLSTAPTEPLLCKFADGGQKKRQSQSKYPQNGRPWHREGEVRWWQPHEEDKPKVLTVTKSL